MDVGRHVSVVASVKQDVPASGLDDVVGGVLVNGKTQRPAGTLCIGSMSQNENGTRQPVFRTGSQMTGGFDGAQAVGSPVLPPAEGVLAPPMEPASSDAPPDPVTTVTAFPLPPVSAPPLPSVEPALSPVPPVLVEEAFPPAPPEEPPSLSSAEANGLVPLPPKRQPTSSSARQNT